MCARARRPGGRRPKNAHGGPWARNGAPGAGNRPAWSAGTATGPRGARVGPGPLAQRGAPCGALWRSVAATPGPLGRRRAQDYRTDLAQICAKSRAARQPVSSPRTRRAGRQECPGPRPPLGRAGARVGLGGVRRRPGGVDRALWAPVAIPAGGGGRWGVCRSGAWWHGRPCMAGAPAAGPVPEAQRSAHVTRAAPTLPRRGRVEGWLPSRQPRLHGVPCGQCPTVASILVLGRDSLGKSRLNW